METPPAPRVVCTISQFLPQGRLSLNRPQFRRRWHSPVNRRTVPRLACRPLRKGRFCECRGVHCTPAYRLRIRRKPRYKPNIFCRAASRPYIPRGKSCAKANNPIAGAGFPGPNGYDAGSLHGDGRPVPYGRVGIHCIDRRTNRRGGYHPPAKDCEFAGNLGINPTFSARRLIAAPTFSEASLAQKRTIPS